MEHTQIQETLRHHIGEKVFIEHVKKRGLESETCYDYAVISRLDPSHLIVITAYESTLLSSGIPYSAIRLVAKSHLYFHDEKDEVIFRSADVKENTDEKVPRM